MVYTLTNIVNKERKISYDPQGKLIKTTETKSSNNSNNIEKHFYKEYDELVSYYDDAIGKLS